MNNIEVVYTMWENLKKTGSMDVGQVGFHKQKEVFIMKNCLDAKYRYFFSVVKIENFIRKMFIFLIFLLKTYIVGTR